MIEEKIKKELEVFKKYDLMEMFIASPFHESQNLDGNLKEKIFYKSLYCEYEYYGNYKTILDAALKAESQSRTRPFIRFFVGYAGIGKTTFLRKFCSDRKNKLSYSFFDFTATTSFTHTRDKEVKEYQSQLKNYFRNIFTQICESQIDQVIDLLKEINTNIMCYYQGFSQKFTDYLESFIDTLHSQIKPINLITFINNIQYSEIYLLLLLIYNKYTNTFIDTTEGNISMNYDSDKKFLLIIDNIDGIDMEGYASRIPKYLLLIYNLYLKLIKKSDYFDSLKSIDFIYVMRDTIHSVINPHDEDYYNVRNIVFSPCKDNKEQLLKRIKFSLSCGIKVIENIKYIMKSIYDDKDRSITNLYIPLFNYNHRKICQYLFTISVENNVFMENIKKIVEMNKNIEEINGIIVGARGILFFLFIRYMQREDYFREAFFFDEGVVIEEDGKNSHINIPRIILTSLHSLGKYCLDTEHMTESTTSVGLFSLYDQYAKVFQSIGDKEKRFLHMIATLFLFYKRNWSHLVSFSNKSIKDEHSFDKEIKLLQNYNETKDFAEKLELKRELDKIKISLNSSGYIYLKDIIRHYEFFSIRENPKPLFASVELFPNNRHVYEFAINITNTYRIVKKCINSLKEFLEIKRHKDFEKESYCFRIFNRKDTILGEYDLKSCYYDERKPGRLYINRIVDFHTEYIDRFRIYLLNSNNLIKEYSDKLNKSEVDIRKSINDILIGFIKKYHELYCIRREQQFEKELVKLQKENIDTIYKEGKNNKYFRRINSRREHKER